MKFDIAVLVSSSDNTQDVLHRVFPSIRRHWPECPFPVYVGKNSPELLPASCNGLFAPPSAWNTELIDQLDQLQVSRVLLLLDDFLLTKPVDTDRLLRIASETVSRNYAYVRLKSLERAILPRMISRMRWGAGDEPLERISPRMPYYSGLQPALWTTRHLRDCLRVANDIWAFEHVVDRGTQHFAVRESVFPCTHVVERGKWLPGAERLFKQAMLEFDTGARPSWPGRMQARIWYGKAKFALFGYSGLRLRKVAAAMTGRGPNSSPSRTHD